MLMKLADAGRNRFLKAHHSAGSFDSLTEPFPPFVWLEPGFLFAHLCLIVTGARFGV